ncbi:MAG: Ig-like domain-containing protein [Eubacterium sp.]|nr:Ig-like domain-containing protein [Eubacterium sp.]
MKKTAKTILTCLALCASISCLASGQRAQAKVKISKVTATCPTGKTAYVAKGKKVKITATVKAKPDKKKNKKVRYVSKNKKIATVSKKGYIKGKKAGKTTIYVISRKNKKKKAKIKVVVKKKAITSIQLNQTSLALNPGNTFALKATIKPAKKVSKRLIWTSSNSQVATVSSAGLVTARSTGEATITAKATDGSKKKATASLIVGAGLESLTLIDSKHLQVRLNMAYPLTAGDFTLETMTTGSGTSQKVPISNISTSNKITYDIYTKEALDLEKEGLYLRLTASSLARTKSLELGLDSQGDRIYGDSLTSFITGQQGISCHEVLDFAPYSAQGSLSWTYDSLPKGISLSFSKQGTRLSLSGSFQNIEEGTKTILTGQDQAGKTYTHTLVFCVGSHEKLVALSKRSSYTDLTYHAQKEICNNLRQATFGLDLTTDLDYSDFICLSGGSLNYQISLLIDGKPLSDFAYDSEGKKVTIDPGTYTLTLMVTDLEDLSQKFSFSSKLILLEGKNLSGTIKDQAGKTTDQTLVRLTGQRDSYGDLRTYEVFTEEDGSYNLRFLPGIYYTSLCHPLSLVFDQETGQVKLNQTGGLYRDDYKAMIANLQKSLTFPYYMVKFQVADKAYTACQRQGEDAYQVQDQKGIAYPICNSTAYDTGQFFLYSFLPAGNYTYRENLSLLLGSPSNHQADGYYTLEEEKEVSTDLVGQTFSVKTDTSLDLSLADK